MTTAEQILSAARRAFDRSGLAGLSLRLIAKKVGITPMAIYRHYANKQALIDALVLDALAEWSEIVAAIAPGEPLDWMRRIGLAHLDFALEKPRRYEAAFLIHTQKARRYPDDFLAGRSPAGRLQLDLVGKLMERGILSGESAMEIVLMNVALCQGLITLYRAGRTVGGEEEFRDMYQRSSARLFSSFATKASS
jgi:AcrR family transcriptional regulator